MPTLFTPLNLVTTSEHVDKPFCKGVPPSAPCQPQFWNVLEWTSVLVASCLWVSTVDIWGWIILCRGTCGASLTSSHLVAHTFPPPNKNVLRNCPLYPGEAESLQLENHWDRDYIYFSWIKRWEILASSSKLDMLTSLWASAGSQWISDVVICLILWSF